MFDKKTSLWQYDLDSKYNTSVSRSLEKHKNTFNEFNDISNSQWHIIATNSIGNQLIKLLVKQLEKK